MLEQSSAEVVTPLKRKKITLHRNCRLPRRIEERQFRYNRRGFLADGFDGDFHVELCAGF